MSGNWKSTLVLLFLETSGRTYLQLQECWITKEFSVWRHSFLKPPSLPLLWRNLPCLLPGLTIQNSFVGVPPPVLAYLNSGIPSPWSDFCKSLYLITLLPVTTLMDPYHMKENPDFLDTPPTNWHLANLTILSWVPVILLFSWFCPC